MNGRFSRRAFLAGMGGSAVSAVAVWELAGLGFRSRLDDGEAPIVKAAESFALHDGWLVTVPDKRLLEFPVRYLEGWYPEERTAEETWRWSRKGARIRVPNLGVEAVVYVDYESQAALFPDRPRTVTVSVGDRVVGTFAEDAPGRQRRRVAVPAAVSGHGEAFDLTVAADRSFTPAERVAGSRDRRELGLQVYGVEIREAGSSR